MQSEFYGTEIFLDNEATKEYLDICRKALMRGEDGNYFEEHMVIPADFWRFIKGYVPGKIKDIMPEEKKVYCKLTPEEHWRSHELLVEMFPEKTKQHSIAVVNFLRIKNNIKKATSSSEYGDAKRRENPHWKQYTDEAVKYHPEMRGDYGAS